MKSANDKGLLIGFLPTWGDKWNKKWGVGPEIFTPANAEAYGEWLGRRYRTRASSGSSAATGPSRTRRRARSCGRWRAGYGAATAGRT